MSCVLQPCAPEITERWRPHRLTTKKECLFMAVDSCLRASRCQGWRPISSASRGAPILCLQMNGARLRRRAFRESQRAEDRSRRVLVFRSSWRSRVRYEAGRVAALLQLAPSSRLPEWQVTDGIGTTGSVANHRSGKTLSSSSIEAKSASRKPFRLDQALRKAKEVSESHR